MSLEYLHRLIGREHPLDELSSALRTYARALQPAVIGAYQISCSDESEKENVKTFHYVFVRQMLPALKYWSSSSFRTANLGARYERGAIGIAEDHFAVAASAESFKLLVVKLNTHVSVAEQDGEVVYGRMNRYDRESVYCGALHAMLDGVDIPATRELSDLFRSGGIDRIAMLRGGDIPPNNRPLAAAIAAAKLQTDQITADIGRHTPHTPTIYAITSCVTLNRSMRDTELFCGLAIVDTRDDPNTTVYRGLGDDPSAYQWSSGPTLAVTER